VYQQQLQAQPGANEVKVNAALLTPQVYILKVSDRQGGNPSIQKFIKQ
jgi:hypothetical protein